MSWAACGAACGAGGTVGELPLRVRGADLVEDALHHRAQGHAAVLHHGRMPAQGGAAPLLPAQLRAPRGGADAPRRPGGVGRPPNSQPFAAKRTSCRLRSSNANASSVHCRAFGLSLCPQAGDGGSRSRPGSGCSRRPCTSCSRSPLSLLCTPWCWPAAQMVSRPARLTRSVRHLQPLTATATPRRACLALCVVTSLHAHTRIPSKVLCCTPRTRTLAIRP